MTQSAFFTPALLSCCAGGLAGDRLALADVGDRTEVLPLVDAGVDGDDRDAAATAALMLFSSPSGLAIETTSPSVPAATALSISVACFPTSGSLW